MPLYEYKCPIHGIFDVLRRNQEFLGFFTQVGKCPKCNLPSPRIISAVNFNRNVWRDKSIELNKYCLTPEEK